MAHVYRELIGTRYLLQARVFDGIEELLTALRRQGYLLSTASLKRQITAAGCWRTRGCCTCSTQ